MKKNLLRRNKIFVVLFTLVLFASSTYFALAGTKSSTLGAVNLNQGFLSTSSTLIIPSINTYSKVEETGLNDEGDMEVPKGRENVAWYKGGPPPGDVGSSVIAGHFGWKDDEPAVFDNLHLLSAGDRIYVRGSNNKIVVFIVRETKTYSPEEDATEIFVSNDGKAHLNLITCGGDWDKRLQSRTLRLVVFADKEEV